MKLSEKQLLALREAIEKDPSVSEKRRRHILAVERMAVTLGELYARDSIEILRAAALLHDLTKEYTTERHLELLHEAGRSVREVEIRAPKTLHAMTAAQLIPELYPEFADPEIISAVRWHTTGRAGMTLIEKLIFLADYIDDSRSFEDCVALRRAFFDADPESMTAEERLSHLDRILTMAYKMTISALVAESCCINPDTLEAYNELACGANKN